MRFAILFALPPFLQKLPNRRPYSAPVMSAALPSGITRRRIPLITKDLVTIANPEVLRKVAASPDILRPGEVELPWLLRTFFSTAEVYYADEDSWFIALLGDGQNNGYERRKIVEDHIAKGFSPERIEKLTEAVRGNGDQVDVAAEVAKAIGDLVLHLPEGQTIPQEIAEASYLSGKDLSIVFNPYKLWLAYSENRKVQAYLRTVLSEKDVLVDFLHHLAAGAQGMGRGLMTLRGQKETTDMRAHFCNNPVLSNGVLRVPARKTTVGGIFPEDAPLLPSSIVALDIMSCAKMTMDDRFLFDVGIEKRGCPFRNLFFETTAEIQRRLMTE